MQTTKFSDLFCKVFNFKFITLLILFLTFTIITIITIKKTTINPTQNSGEIKYIFPEEGFLFKNNNISRLDKKILNNYPKLVYILNINCSVCIFNLSKIYDTFNKLYTKNENLQFVIITKDYPDSYITYFLHKSLSNYENYKVWVFKKKNFKHYNSEKDFFLLNNKNKILYSTSYINSFQLEKELTKLLEKNTYAKR